MQCPGLELDLVPAKRDELADAKAVSVGEEEEGTVAVSVPADLAGGREKLLDLVRRQMLSSAARGVRDAPRGEGRARGRSRSPLLRPLRGLRGANLPIYECWRLPPGCGLARDFGHPRILYLPIKGR